MNEVHLTGVVKYTWIYDSNLYARVSVARDGDRPNRSPEGGGNYDYITVMFPGAAVQGLALARTQTVTVHGWIQSRDVNESLADFYKQANRRNGSSNGNGNGTHLPEHLPDVSVHRTMTEIVAARWLVESELVSSGR